MARCLVRSHGISSVAKSRNPTAEMNVYYRKEPNNVFHARK